MNETHKKNLENTRISSEVDMITPIDLKEKHPIDDETASFIETSREIITNIVNMKDDRLAVITWPCSIHDPKLALEIANKIVILKEQFPNLYPIMRVYFEKPRTIAGWKWLINDPDLDDSCNIEKWLEIARWLLLEINKLWVPTAVEFLDTINPQYFSDLVHWWAIWARTTESQEHRKMASWLSMPIWFKNWTNWDIQIALDAIKSSNWSHSFIWISERWTPATLTTTWNPDSHIILRWWSNWTNYDRMNVWHTSDRMDDANIDTWIIVDLSHANSKKDHNNQPIVSKDVSEQIAEWNKKIVWVMIESNINEWWQSHTPWKDNPSDLKYWVSITDKCVNWDTNNEMMTELNQAAEIRKNK